MKTVERAGAIRVDLLNHHAQATHRLRRTASARIERRDRRLGFRPRLVSPFAGQGSEREEHVFVHAAASSRLRTLLTCIADHAPPRTVSTPAAVSRAAIARKLTINLKARGARPVELRKRISGVWCSEWERQGEYRMRPRWLSLYTKDEGVARQRFDALVAEFGDAAATQR